MTSSELKDKCVELLEERKASNIKVIDIGEVSSISDYFIIATGTSNTNIVAMSEYLEFKLKEIGISPNHVEGYRSSNWILLDYGDIVVHIFLESDRKYYNLEEFWQNQTVKNDCGKE